MGTVARREKEVREQEKRQLTGAEGKLLYLEALQLLLRSQVLWLIRVKGYREELETVVRDLWDLRIRGSSSLEPSVEDAAAEASLEMFSSQPPSEEDKPAWSSGARAQIWDPDRGAGWPMPKVPDTIGICYLGCLLLRIPTRLGELIQWANRGDLPYKTAVSWPSICRYRPKLTLCSSTIFHAKYKTACRRPMSRHSSSLFGPV